MFNRSRAWRPKGMPQKGFAMKTWIRRSLIGLATVSVSVVAGLAACGHGPMGGSGPEAGMGPGMGMMRQHHH